MISPLNCSTKPQDLLVYALKGLSLYAVEGRKVRVNDWEVNVFTCEALFSTLTNVNFDPERIAALIHKTVTMMDSLKEKVRAAGGKVDFTEDAANFKPAGTLEGLDAQGQKVGLKSDPTTNPDILSLQHVLQFGIKGVAAYADHAHILGQDDDAVYAFVQEGLVTTLRKDLELNDMVGLAMKCGEMNLGAMELLDATPGQEPDVRRRLPLVDFEIQRTACIRHG